MSLHKILSNENTDLLLSPLHRPSDAVCQTSPGPSAYEDPERPYVTLWKDLRIFPHRWLPDGFGVGQTHSKLFSSWGPGELQVCLAPLVEMLAWH